MSLVAPTQYILCPNAQAMKLLFALLLIKRGRLHYGSYIIETNYLREQHSEGRHVSGPTHNKNNESEISPDPNSAPCASRHLIPAKRHTQHGRVKGKGGQHI